MFYALRRPVPQTDQTVIAIMLPRSEFSHVHQGALALDIGAWWIRGTIPSVIGDLETLDAEAVDQLNDLPGWRLYLRPRTGGANRVFRELRKGGYHGWCNVPNEIVARLEVIVGEGPTTEPFDPIKHVHLTKEKHYLGPPRVPHAWSLQDKAIAVPW